MADLMEPLKNEQKEAAPERITQKFNRNAGFDKEDFLTQLFENYLVAVQRHEDRDIGKIITKWNEFTSFDDFLKDSLTTIDEKLTSIKMAKEAQTQKFKIFDDSVLSEVKMDTQVAGQRFNVEDYEGCEELLKRGRDVINDYRAGKIQLVVDTQTGRSRVG